MSAHVHLRAPLFKRKNLNCSKLPSVLKYLNDLEGRPSGLNAVASCSKVATVKLQPSGHGVKTAQILRLLITVSASSIDL